MGEAWLAWRRAPKAWSEKAACGEGDRKGAKSASRRLYEMRRRVARIEMSTFYAVLSVRPHTVCNRNLDIRTGQGDLGS